MAFTLRSDREPAQTEQAVGLTWPCAHCHRTNWLHRYDCSSCGQPKPPPPKQPDKPTMKGSFGDDDASG